MVKVSKKKSESVSCCLCVLGNVYGIGRADDGRLAQGEDPAEIHTSLVKIDLRDQQKATDVAAGLSTSFAVSSSG